MTLTKGTLTPPNWAGSDTIAILGKMTFSAIAHYEVTAQPGEAGIFDSVAQQAQDNHLPRWLTRAAGMAEALIEWF